MCVDMRVERCVGRSSGCCAVRLIADVLQERQWLSWKGGCSGILGGGDGLCFHGCRECPCLCAWMHVLRGLAVNIWGGPDGSPWSTVSVSNTKSRHELLVF